ncbi:MAG TPA: amidohydrolase family protein [Candidatus Binatia bacterium]|jgi:cytosine/adenosine deaminase-related metal-dependent hydrolase|nr:amidohydrolase family protein [Candidatus Binatia bacterium]
MILRARVVLPISGPAIENGAVQVEGERIGAVGRWRDLAAGNSANVLDLGEVVVLPGLVNAHCHLDYTHMAGHFSPPKIFTDWLKQITSTKAGWDLADYSASWLSGADMLLRSGTTTVADIEAVPQLLPKMWNSTPLRVLSFLEMIGITSRRTPRAVLKETLQKIASLHHPRCQPALSPHAPYSTLPELLRLSTRTARRRGWRLCIHVAESGLEFAMFTQGSGEMFDWLRRSGRDMSDCGQGSPVQHLERCGVLDDNLLVAHVNYLARADAALLGRRQVSVVHCPRSHSYFRHNSFQLTRLRRAGVNLCLGTDSLASVEATRRHPAQLNLFDEMRALASREPRLSAKSILQMATVNGARALGMQGRAGELAAGALADLIAVPFPGKVSRVYDAALHHKGDVVASMIGGHWALAPEAK